MLDIKVIIIKDVLVVNQVGYLANFAPRTLDIQGEGFLQASEVLINDLPAPEFIVVSNSKILAQIPDSQTRTTITSVGVFAYKPSASRKSVLHFDAGTSISGLTGLEKLVQLFAKMLIQTPGSDRFHPEEGGGLLNLVGQPVGKKNASSLSATVATAVSRTKDQLMTRQSKVNRIPPDERLLRADIQAIGYNPATTTLAVRVAVGAVSGREAVANLTF